MIYTNMINPHNMLCKVTIHYPRISSHGLIQHTRAILVELFNRTHFLTKYFMNNIHMNSETLGLLFMTNHPTSIPSGEPKIHSRFRPYTHQSIIYGINHTTSSPNSLWTVMDCTIWFHNFSHSGPKFWDRSNGHSRPQTNRNITKHLNKV